MNEIQSVLLQAILPAAGTVLLVALIAVARQYAAKIKDERLRALVLALVKAAEQIYGAKKGTEKKAYVEANAPKSVTPAVIEAAVFEMKKGV
jgi:hypothetical protein